MALEKLIALNDELARASGRAFDSGFQMIQQSKANSLNMAWKKMQMDQAAQSFPLELDQLRRAGQVQELNMQILQHRKEIELDELEGAKDLASVIAQYPANDPRREAEMWKVGERHPSLLGRPEFKLGIDEVEKSNTATIKRQEAENKTTALQNQLETAFARLGLLQQQITSRENTAKESNATRLEVARLRAANGGLSLFEQGLVPRARLVKFKSDLKAIDDDPLMDAATKETKHNELFNQLQREADARAKAVLPRTQTQAPPGPPPALASPPAITKITTKAERDALPPGTHYVGPDGREYIKR